MVLINLLPHREIARKQRKEAFYKALGASVFAGVVVSGLIYLWYQSQISSQNATNAALQAETAKLELQIKDIATLQAEINALKARQLAVEDLQADRNLPVHLLNDLVKLLPSGVYLNSLKQENQGVTLQGVAQSNERVSELLRNLATSSTWLTKPELVVITSDILKLGSRDGRRVANFTIKVQLLRASELQKQANPASAPASVPASAISAPKAAS